MVRFAFGAEHDNSTILGHVTIHDLVLMPCNFRDVATGNQMPRYPGITVEYGDKTVSS